MLDAYTIRKAVPRIVIAVIGINLSIYLCVAAIDLTNIVGRGLGDLLYAPFLPENGRLFVESKSIEVNTSNTLAATGFLSIAVGALLVKAATVGVFALLGSIFPILFIIALIALAVLFTLVIRQGLLIFLSIASPVAIACFVLPGTEKYFKQWSDLFIKTLMVYPIIAVIFAMSNVMGTILLSSATATGSILNPASLINFAQSGGQSDAQATLQIIAAILVIYAPLVLIPFAFKFAGGAIGAVMNAAQNSTAGKRGQLAKGRSAKLDQAKQKRAMLADQGGLKGGWKRPVNSAYNAVGRRRGAGTLGVTRQGREKMALHTMGGVEETLKNNSALRQLANNDDANNLLALSGGSEAGMQDAAKQIFRKSDGSYDEVRAKAAMNAARAVGVTRQNAAAALQTSAQNKWRAVDPNRSDIIQDGIGRLAGSNASEAASLAYGNQFHSRSNGRIDLGGNNMDLDDQAVTDYATQHSLSPVQAQQELATLDGIGRVSAQEAVRGHTASVKGEAEVLQRAMAAGTPDQKAKAIQRMLELNGHKAGAPPANRDIINKMIEDAGVDPNSGHSAAVQLAAKSINVNPGDLNTLSDGHKKISENKALEQRAVMSADPAEAAHFRSLKTAETLQDQQAALLFERVKGEATRLTKGASVYGDDIPENMRSSGG